PRRPRDGRLSVARGRRRTPGPPLERGAERPDAAIPRSPSRGRGDPEEGDAARERRLGRLHGPSVPGGGPVRPEIPASEAATFPRLAEVCGRPALRACDRGP